MSELGRRKMKTSRWQPDRCGEALSSIAAVGRCILDPVIFAALERTPTGKAESFN